MTQHPCSHICAEGAAPYVAVPMLALLSCSMRSPELRLHAEEVVLSLVRMRKKQLAMAAAVEAARNASPEGEEDDEPTPDQVP